jgi:hypothetical protein
MFITLNHIESQIFAKETNLHFKNRLGHLIKVKIPYFIKKKVKMNSKYYCILRWIFRKWEGFAGIGWS